MKLSALILASTLAITSSGAAIYGALLEVGPEAGHSDPALRFLLPPIQPAPQASRFGAAEPAVAVQEAASTSSVADNSPAVLIGATSNQFADAKRPMSKAVRDFLSAAGLPDVQFDLAGYPSPRDPMAEGGALTITKSIHFNGESLGEMRIHVLSGSTIAIERSEIVRLFPGTARPGLPAGAGDSGANKLLTFDDLRTMGIAIRYDPVVDRLMASTAG